MVKELIKFYQGTKIKASEVNFNFEQMEDMLNERINELRTYLENEFEKVSGNFVLPGTIIHVAYGSVPPGYLKCDGSEYLRADYPDLFNAIGTIYGSSDSTKFKVPDFRGMFLRGYGGNSSSIGQKQACGVPNITGGGGLLGDRGYTLSGAFYNGGVKTNNSVDSQAHQQDAFSFSARRVSTVYQDGLKELRPDNFAVMLCIKY